jgi:hypothetical protein
LAIEEALRALLAPPARKAEDQIYPGYEGMDAFAGLGVGRPYVPRETIRQEVQEDWVAAQLPLMVPRTEYPFIPTLLAFQNAAHDLKLYPGESNGERHTDGK